MTPIVTLVVDQLVRQPNVYADTAGVRRFDYLVQAVKRAGAHKLIFGSDGPWLHPGIELAKIRALGLPAAEEQLVLSGNVLRLINKQQRTLPYRSTQKPSRLSNARVRGVSLAS